MNGKILVFPPNINNMNSDFRHTIPLKWGDIYLLPGSSFLDSKLTQFQYKVFTRILYANEAFYKVG